VVVQRVVVIIQGQFLPLVQLVVLHPLIPLLHLVVLVLVMVLWLVVPGERAVAVLHR
jgi:hypothetical protein